MPTPDSPEPSIAGADGLPQPRGFLGRRLADGTAIVAVLCVPVVGVFGFLAVQTAHQHHWADAARDIWLAVVFLGIPTLAWIWLDRLLKSQRPRRGQ